MCKNFLKIPFSIRCSFECFFVFFYCCFLVGCSLSLTLAYTSKDKRNGNGIHINIRKHIHICIHISHLDIHMFFSDVDIYNMESVLILMVDAGHWTNFIRLSFSLVVYVFVVHWIYVLISILFHISNVLFCSIHIAPIHTQSKTIHNQMVGTYTKKHIRVKILRPRTLSNEIEREKKENFQRISHLYRSPIPITITP